jgi:hypothetical protein
MRNLLSPGWKRGGVASCREQKLLLVGRALFLAHGNVDLTRVGNLLNCGKRLPHVRVLLTA